MTSLERLIARLQRQPAEAELRDIVRLLEALGWERRSQEGSHVVYVRRAGRIAFPVVGGRRVKRVYVNDILQRLGLK